MNVRSSLGLALACALVAAASSLADPLADLVEKARAQGGEALVVFRNGEVLVDETFGHPREPIYAMSTTKSVLAMALAHLIENDRLELDRPLTAIFPEWDDRGVAPITVRHLLEHTSGLTTARAPFGPGSDILAYALQCPRDAPPGERFVYNNNACDLLAAVVHAVAGVHLDAYLEEHIFGPMGIEGTSWNKDSRGIPRAAGALKILPFDLAKLGQLMLQSGRWAGRQLLGPEALAILVTPQEAYPYVARLWWMVQEFGFSITRELVAQWVAHGFPEGEAAKVEPMFGEVYPNVAEYRAALLAIFPNGELAEINEKFVSGELEWAVPTPRGPSKGYAGRGWLGQYLTVLPGQDLVAVRMRRKRPEDNGQDQSPDTHPDFEKDVVAFAEALAAAGAPNP